MIILNLKWLSTRRLGRLCGNTVWTTTDPWDHRENTRLDRTLYLYPIIMIVRVVVLVLLCFQILQIALIFFVLKWLGNLMKPRLRTHTIMKWLDFKVAA